MTTQYTIYLINNSASTQIFWCFLARPEELVNDPGVFANSSTNLAVAPNAGSVNTFTIPVQYIVGAGASNNAVGLNTKIDSFITQDADLGQMWDANYATVPPNQGPSMMLDGTAAPTGTIAIKANGFNRPQNEANGWFSNMNYGIKTNQGFIGMSWSPSPAQTRTITPKLQFYVATGTYGSNSLANWSDVSNSSAQLSVPDSFQYNKTTVTYTAIGGWNITPGSPPPSSLRARSVSVPSGGGSVPSLIESHHMLAEAHAKLVELAEPGPASDDRALRVAGTTQTEKLIAVKWNPSTPAAAGVSGTYLTGRVTVGTVLATGVTLFVLAGVTFSVLGVVGGLSVDFSYSGPLSVEAVKSLFVVGKDLFFS